MSVLAESKLNRIVNCKWVLNVLSMAIRAEVKLAGSIGRLANLLSLRFIQPLKYFIEFNEVIAIFFGFEFNRVERDLNLNVDGIPKLMIRFNCSSASVARIVNHNSLPLRPLLQPANLF